MAKKQGNSKFLKSPIKKATQHNFPGKKNSGARTATDTVYHDTDDDRGRQYSYNDDVAK